MDKPGLSYKQAGVDIDSANKSVEMIKKWVGQTRRPEVLTDIGSFAGFFALDNKKYTEPILVSGTDGVGTKLKIAQLAGIHETVGIDLVAMCVNDILVHGAEPLFFLDYIGIGKLDPYLVESLVKGVSIGCVDAGCSLIGGETAEMPGFYEENEYDLAGFAVGIVERAKIINGSGIVPGDIIIGLPSSGIHSNGYSLVRKVFLEKAGIKLAEFTDELGKTWGEELLTPTKIYVKSILPILDEVEIKGMAHITGGGIIENLARILPEGTSAVIETAVYPPMPVFAIIAGLGRVAKNEMFKTFNMGIGYVLVTAEKDGNKALDLLRNRGEKPIIIGRVETGTKGVIVV